MARAKRPRQGQNNVPVSVRSPLLPFYLILGLVAVAGIGVLVYQTVGRTAPVVSPIPVEVDAAELARTPGVSMGRQDASVVIFEFADFQCPACAQFSAFFAPVIKERYVDPGTVRYVYYDFPLTQIHRHAFLASRAGRCAEEQGQFWTYHDLLYARQARWSPVGNPTSMFVEYAGEVGVDARTFEACLRSDRYAAEVTQNMQFGESLGVQGTPTLFINGKRLPSIPEFRELDAIIQEEMGTTPAAGASLEGEPDQTGREVPGDP